MKFFLNNLSSLTCPDNCFHPVSHRPDQHNKILQNILIPFFYRSFKFSKCFKSGNSFSNPWKTEILMCLRCWLTLCVMCGLPHRELTNVKHHVVHWNFLDLPMGSQTFFSSARFINDTKVGFSFMKKCQTRPYRNLTRS